MAVCIGLDQFHHILSTADQSLNGQQQRDSLAFVFCVIVAFYNLSRKKLDDFLNKGFKDILYLWMHHLVHTVCGDWLIIKCALRFLSWFHQDLHLLIWTQGTLFLCWIGDLTLSFLFCCILFLDKVDTVTSDWFSWPVFFPSHDYITLIT